MPNYRRWRIEGGCYFFTQVTYQRRNWLTDELARSSLRDAMQTVGIKRPFGVLAIVLLPDHLHTIWQLPRGDFDYSTRWRLIKRRFTRSYVRPIAESKVSPSRESKGERGVWQRRFFEHTCRDENDLKRCIDYLHVNPLKHGLVDRVRDWPWSTFHRYVKMGEYDVESGRSNLWMGDEWKHFD